MAESPAARKSRTTRPPDYLGRTLAYQRYRQCARRTRDLLNAGLLGLSEKGLPLEEVRAKLAGVKGIPGRAPKDYEPEVAVTRKGEDNLLLTMDPRFAVLLRSIVESAVGQNRELRFHFYAILAVYAWGTYETYLTMLFDELYAKRPQLMISNETITYRDVVENRERLIPHLVEQQLDRLGRMSFAESTKYLRDRISYTISDATKHKMASFYVVRNVVAHSTGILRPGTAKSLPRGTSAVGGELRITRSFLLRMLTQLDRHVTLLERHVEKKFFGKVRGDSGRGAV